MALIKFKGLAALEKKVKKRIEDEIKNKAVLTEIGEKLVSNIKGSARLKGNPIFGDDYDELADSTKKARKQAEKTLKKGTNYGTNKSNLTQTGELIESINFTVSNTKPLISIRAEGDHSRAKMSNQDLLEIHQKGLGNNPARPIMGVNDKMKKSATVTIQKHLRRALKK